MFKYSSSRMLRMFCILLIPSLLWCICIAVSIKCRLDIGYKMQTRYKMQTDTKTISVKNTINFRFLTYRNVTQSPSEISQISWFSLVRLAFIWPLPEVIFYREKKKKRKTILSLMSFGCWSWHFHPILCLWGHEWPIRKKKSAKKSRYFRFSPNLEHRKLRNLPSPCANLARIRQLGLHNENFMFGLHTVSNGCRFEETPNVEFDG